MPMPPVVDSWDSGQPGATWDSGLQWDVNIGPSIGSVAPYLALITSEHNQQPDYMDMLSASMQPLADLSVLFLGLPGLFDLDVAVGAQLDAAGEWAGAPRQVTTPLTGVYFSWGDVLLGWGLGTWKGPFDPITGLTSLPDDAYRTLIRARIANNQWDGTIPGAYDIWNTLFAGTGFGILIQDLGGMHMLYALTGPVPDALTLALFSGGYLNIKPAGVRIDAFLTSPEPNVPYFGWGVQNANIAGWGVGHWPIVSTGV